MSSPSSFFPFLLLPLGPMLRSVSMTKDQVQSLSETQAWCWGGEHSDLGYGEATCNLCHKWDGLQNDKYWFSASWHLLNSVLHKAHQLDLIQMFPQKVHLDLIFFQMHKVEMVWASLFVLQRLKCCISSSWQTLSTRTSCSIGLMPNLMYCLYWKHQNQTYFNFRFYSYHYWFFLELFHPICYHFNFFSLQEFGESFDSLYLCGWGLFMWVRAVHQTSLQWPNSPILEATSTYYVICELLPFILTGTLWLRVVV